MAVCMEFGSKVGKGCVVETLGTAQASEMNINKNGKDNLRTKTSCLKYIVKSLADERLTLCNELIIFFRRLGGGHEVLGLFA